MAVNLNRNVDDAFYRYKMPPVVAKVEGKGNGIKTVIVNMTEIAKALARPPGFPTKYFGCELGAQTQIDTKTDRYIVNGDHDAKKLQDLLDGFIKKFVLCENCGNPETHMLIKNEKISLHCIACGHTGPVDMRHKLTTYILKNPPEGATKAPAAKESKSSKKSKSSKESRDAKSEDHEEVSPPSSSKHHAAAEVDDDFGEDADEEAVRKRAAELSAGIAALTTTDDLERSSSDRLQLFHTFVQSHLGDAKFASKVAAEAERLDCKEKAAMVIADLVLDNESELLNKAKIYAPLLQRFLAGNAKAQKYFIGALEKIMEKHPKLVEKFAHILKGLYDLDILEEEGLLSWAEKVSKKYVSKELAAKLHEKAVPFISWLKEAEEESSEEEDEDEVEVAFTSSSTGQTSQASQNDQDDDEEEEPKAVSSHITRGLTVAKKVEDDDDLDIDAI